MRLQFSRATSQADGQVMNTQRTNIKCAVVTGAAGFIGSYVAHALLDRNIRVIGIDNVNDYYIPILKQKRLERLGAREGFAFHKADIADYEALKNIEAIAEADIIIHLAAQAGVRYSLENPFAYAASNLVGHLAILELVRHAKNTPRLIYASSSSVYGSSTKAPFSENDEVTHPVSLYAATKRSDELLSESYANLYNLEQIGLRFFTVYGPWGRPDMAYWTFTENILSGKPIRVFNHGDMMRDFTYIDDIVEGVIATALLPASFTPGPPHKIYNIGNNKPERLMHFIEILEREIGRKAIMQMEPMQPGDVPATYADISAISKDYGFTPKTSLETGLRNFVAWYRDFRKTLSVK